MRSTETDSPATKADPPSWEATSGNTGSVIAVASVKRKHGRKIVGSRTIE